MNERFVEEEEEEEEEKRSSPRFLGSEDRSSSFF